MDNAPLSRDQLYKQIELAGFLNRAGKSQVNPTAVGTASPQAAQYAVQQPWSQREPNAVELISRAQALTGMLDQLASKQQRPSTSPVESVPAQQAAVASQLPQNESSQSAQGGSVESLFSDEFNKDAEARKAQDAARTASMMDSLGKPATAYQAQQFASSPLPSTPGVSQQQIGQLLAAASRQPLPTFGPDAMVTGWQNPNAAISAQMLGIGLNAANDNLGIQSQYQTADMDRQAQFAGLQNHDATNALIEGHRLMQDDSHFNLQQNLAEVLGLTDSANRTEQTMAQSDLARAQAEAMRSSAMSPVEQMLNALQMKRAESDPAYASDYEEQLRQKLNPQTSNQQNLSQSGTPAVPTMNESISSFNSNTPTVEAALSSDVHDMNPLELVNSLVRDKRPLADRDLKSISNWMRSKYHLDKTFRLPQSGAPNSLMRADKLLSDLLSGKDITQATLEELRNLEAQQSAENASDHQGFWGNLGAVGNGQF